MPSAQPIKVALVTQDIRAGGGVWTMTKFLHRALSRADDFLPEIICLSTSANDAASVRIRAPHSWLQGVRTEQLSKDGLRACHVGAWFTEIETQRYRPRRQLDALLGEYDLFQFVVGIASWGNVARRLSQPCCLWVATTARAERVSRLKTMGFPRRLWGQAMASAVQRLEQRALEQADRIFALSHYTRGALQEILPGKESRIVPCGVDVREFRPGDPDCGGHDYIISVGRFDDPRKNFPLALRAYALVVAEMENAPDLVIVGDPPRGPALEAVRREGLDDNVQFVGPKYGADLASLLRGARLFLLSSDEEGLAIVLLEAMASGVPVVSTRCGGPESIIDDGESGYLTPVGDARALSEAILRLLRDDQGRRAMGKRARRVAEKRYSVDAVQEEFLRAYSDLLD